MTTDSEVIGGVTVVRLDGDLDTNTSGSAETFLTELRVAGCDKMLIDLSSIEYVSSAGLRVLLATAKQFKANQGTLKLCGLNETVQDVFEISGFIAILDVMKSQDEALAAF